MLHILYESETCAGTNKSEKTQNTQTNGMETPPGFDPGRKKIII